MTELKPGFYPDPERENFIRHWNGKSWDEVINDSKSSEIEVEKQIPLEEIPLEERYEKFEGSDLEVFLTTNNKTKGPWGLIVKIYDWLVLYIGGAVRQTGDIPEGERRGDVKFGNAVSYRSRRGLATRGRVLGRKGTLIAMTFFSVINIAQGIMYHDLLSLLFGLAFAIITVLVYLKKMRISR